MPILIVIVVVMLMAKAVSESKMEHALAQKGIVPPRMQARYGGGQESRARVAKYGFTDHLRDAWRDSWARRTDALVAARNARAADGRRPGWRDRWRAARTVVDAPSAPLDDWEPPAPRPVDEPVPVPDTMPEPAPDATTPEPVLPPPALAEPVPAPAADDMPAGGLFDDEVDQPAESPRATSDPTSETADAADLDEVAGPAPTFNTTGGTPMATATGEAVNYETALSTLDDMIHDTQTQVDAAKAALDSMATAKANVDAMQQSYAGDAAATKLDHEASMNLDGTTLGHAGTTVDALPVGAVDTLYEATEQVEAAVQVRLTQAEVALASLEAEREHLIATYGDAHATVAGNLGGDSRFLNSGPGSAPAQPQAQPAPEHAAA